VCGPVPLRERFAAPDAALAVATGDAAAREFGWRRLENATPRDQLPARKLGAEEPPARSRG
jgi:hypothetical protein